MTGRPSSYSIELAEEICEQLVGGKSLVSICNREDMPSYRTVMRWLEASPDFRQKYAIAREAQADFLAEEIIDIADDGSMDNDEDEDGNSVVKSENIQRSRLRVDARKWYASKLVPKKYGDRQEVAMTLSTPPLPEEDRALLDEYAKADNA